MKALQRARLVAVCCKYSPDVLLYRQLMTVLLQVPRSNFAQV
jgi:hypothetical protein